MSGGIWLIDRDEQGNPTGARIVVELCATDPDHPIADEWLDGVFLCRPCALKRRAEAARLARLSRLSVEHRQWLAERGVTDWGAR